MAFNNHPDRNITSQQSATTKFQEISQAYNILKDPSRKKQYDEFGTVSDDEELDGSE